MDRVDFIVERDSDFNRLAQSVRNIGHNLIELEQFGDYKTDEPAVFFGSINAVKYHYKKRWYPGSWCDWKEFCCSTYYAKLGPWLLQQEYAFMPLGEVHRRKRWLFDTFANEQLIFIRPDGGDKPFHGERVSEYEFEHWWKIANFYEPGADCLSVVSKPSKILHEFRFVIHNGLVITGSTYRINGDVKYIKVDNKWGAWGYAQEVINETKYGPHPIFVIDIAELENREHRVVEVGSINCCGMYECDTDLIAEAVAQEAVEGWKLYNE